MDESESGSSGGSVDDILAHFGKKGMKWGTRNEIPLAASGYRGVGVGRVTGESSPSKKGTALAGMIVNLQYSDHKVVGPKVNAELVGLKKKYDDAKFSNDAYYAKYRKEAHGIYEKHLSESLPKGLTTSVLTPKNLDMPPYVVIGNKKGVDNEVKLLLKEGFSHSETSPDVIRLKLNEVRDSSGFITGISLGDAVESNQLTQSEDVVDSVLAHWGKKGMHWGRRKKETSTSEPSDLNPVTLYSRPGKGITDVKGGESRLPSSDAKSAAVSKQIARKSGSDALSNAELNHLLNRVNLDQKYSKMVSDSNSRSKSRGRRFVENLFKKEGMALATGKAISPAVLAVALPVATIMARKSKHGVVTPKTFVNNDYIGRHQK
jgi:hypothetical protein